MKILVNAGIISRIGKGDVTAVKDMGLYNLKYQSAILNAIEKAILDKNVPMLTAIKNVPNLPEFLFIMAGGQKTVMNTSLLTENNVPKENRIKPRPKIEAVTVVSDFLNGEDVKPDKLYLAIKALGVDGNMYLLSKINEYLDGAGAIPNAAGINKSVKDAFDYTETHKKPGDTANTERLNIVVLNRGQLTD